MIKFKVIFQLWAYVLNDGPNPELSIIVEAGNADEARRLAAVKLEELYFLSDAHFDTEYLDIALVL